MEMKVPKLNFDGIIPAIAVPFNADFSIDEADSTWIAWFLISDVPENIAFLQFTV